MPCFGVVFTLLNLHDQSSSINGGKILDLSLSSIPIVWVIRHFSMLDGY